MQFDAIYSCKGDLKNTSMSIIPDKYSYEIDYTVVRCPDSKQDNSIAIGILDLRVFSDPEFSF